MNTIKANGLINSSYVIVPDFELYKEMIKDLNVKYVFSFPDIDNLTLNNTFRDPSMRHHTHSSGQSPDCFGFSVNGTWYLCLSNGHQEIEVYDEALNLGCHNKKDYKRVKEGGFENYQDYKEAEQKGFASKADMLEALQMGCANRTEYNAVKGSGFIDKDEYTKAKTIGANNKSEYLEYQDYEKYMEENNLRTHDEVVLHKYLVQNISGLNIEALSFKKLFSQISRSILFKSAKWYKTGIANYDFFANYVLEYKKSDEYFYNTAADKFMEKPVVFSNTEIVLDGSNIAWNNGNSASGDKPLIRNVILVAKDLLNKGFISIRIFFDANIEHEIDDTQTYKQLENTFNIKKVPAGEKADKFILEYAKENKTYVISNDQFSEYYAMDKWLEKHLEKIKVKFSINGDKVTYDKPIAK